MSYAFFYTSIAFTVACFAIGFLLARRQTVIFPKVKKYDPPPKFSDELKHAKEVLKNATNSNPLRDIVERNNADTETKPDSKLESDSAPIEPYDRPD